VSRSWTAESRVNVLDPWFDPVFDFLYTHLSQYCLQSTGEILLFFWSFVYNLICCNCFVVCYMLSL